MTTCMSCLPTGGPVQENSGGAQRREETPAHYIVLPTSQNPSCCNPSWLKDVHATRKTLSQARKGPSNPETNLITTKPETVSHVAEQFSWVPLCFCSLPRSPFPIKSLASSACVSPWTIHFRVLDKTPVLGPERGPPSCCRAPKKVTLGGGAMFDRITN